MANDLANLQGAWSLTTLEMDGRSAPAGGGIEIDGDRFRAVGMGADYSGTVELDESAKPKRLDLVFTEGPEAGNRNLGIYDLNGDTWKICLNITGKGRPKSFSATAGTGNALEIFERGAPTLDEQPTTSDIVATGEGELVGEWEMVAAWQGGFALEDSMVKTGRRITSPTHTTTVFGKQVFMKASYTTDATQSPRTIDLLHVEGRNKGKTQLGIYEVDGDTMKICFTVPGKPRPTDFESNPDDGRTSAVWKLVKR